MLYLQIASPKSSVLNFLDSNSFEVIISIFQRTEKVPDMERLQPNLQKLFIMLNDCTEQEVAELLPAVHYLLALMRKRDNSEQ